MKVKWLIEEGKFQRSFDSVIESLKRHDIEYKTAKWIPFHEENKDHLIQLFDKDDCVVTFSSLHFARDVNKYCPWIPGVYYDCHKYECNFYYPKLHEFLLNKPYIMLPLGDLINQKQFLFDTLGSSDTLFLRPSSGFKIFTGFAVSKEEYEKEISLIEHFHNKHDSIVVASAPRNIRAEWRFVIVDKQIVACSQYMLNDEMDEKEGAPKEIYDYAEKACKVWEPEKVWVLDVCQLTNGEIYVLEIGSFSCAGLYDCKIDPIVEAVSKQALLDWQEYQE